MIGRLGLSSISFRDFVIGSQGTLFLVVIGRLPSMTFGVMFLGCCVDEKP